MTVDKSAWEEKEFQEAFVENERQERIRSGKVACALVMVLMPAGIILDLFVYPERVLEFFQLRLLCALLAGGWWAVHQTSYGQRHYRWLGIPIAILPAIFISWMIIVTEGPESPYYAGLILVLLAVNAIVHWTTGESLLALAVIYLLYFLACVPWPVAQEQGIFFNNIYFLVLTGIIVVTGNYLYNQLHFREFVLRFKLGQSRHALEATNRKLVELDRIKSRFFANISHELRTPLTLLLTPLQNLIHDRSSAFETDIRQLLLIMQSNGMRLLKLINDLLDLVRLESGKMEVNPGPVDVNRLLQGIANAVTKMAEDRAIRLEVTSDRNIDTLMVDGDKLERVVLNLLFNALKFTPAGGKICVTASRKEGQLLLEISDTGNGISEEQLPFIFDRFWQADSSSQDRSQGVGIGLALVKELVEIQGGNVAVTSKIGIGTQFKVWLPYRELEDQVSSGRELERPLRANPPPILSRVQGDNGAVESLNRAAELHPSIVPLRESLKPVESSIHTNRPRVLIADDEPDMLKYLKSQLSLNFQVIEAVDGQQAFEKACQFLPDVIVCDMMMPHKSGIQVCRELRERTYTHSIPILMLTARADEETKFDALSAGANDFITKPFSSTELRVRLKNLADTFHMQQQLARQNQMLEATIEQLKETEMQLVHSEKLASLGRMSAGIIHEINNPLNYAKTGLYVLRKMLESPKVDEKDDLFEILRDVHDGISRVDRIVSDLRAFTHPDVTQFEQLSVAELVVAAFRLVSHEQQKQVKVEKQIASDQTVYGNRNQIIQVLVNLLQNALYAVARRPASNAAPTIWIQGLENASESLLTIRDNGEGIPSANLAKVFDPFFTSKDVGEGMGLGLSICYRIMQQHGGRIEVRSEVGVYSEFTLHFPQTPKCLSVS